MNRIKNISLLLAFLMISAWQINGNNSDSSPSVARAEIRTLQYVKPTVIIYTPETQKYDDGVFLTSYTGYRIFDMENNLLLRVASSIEQPVRLKIKEGEYLLVPDCSKDSVYLLTVKSGITNEFTVPE